MPEFESQLELVDILRPYNQITMDGVGAYVLPPPIIFQRRGDIVDERPQGADQTLDV